MKRGFTLIELLVTVTITVVIAGGALIYLNNFRSRQDLDQNKDEVVSMLKLAQSYARTRQMPIGSSGDLNFVQVKFTNNIIEARANSDVGPSYYSNLISDSNELSIGSTPTVIYFWGGSGKLASDISGTLYSSNQKANIYIYRKSSINAYEKLEVNAMGQVSFTGYVDN